MSALGGAPDPGAIRTLQGLAPRKRAALGRRKSEALMKGGSLQV